MFAKFEKHLHSWQKQELGSLRLDQAIIYSMNTRAKRLRPLIVLMMAQAKQCPLFLDAALSVECLHTASLLADDLPCMDDAKYRRGSIATHHEFGEDVAILASYKLIGWAFKLLAKESKAQKLDAKKTQLVFDCVAMGCIASTDGQILDLESKDGDLKTSPLFEMSFVLGWVFCDQPIEKLEMVKLASHHFGAAFQIQDDLKDLDEDRLNEKPNFALSFGENEAKKKLEFHIETLSSLLKELDCLSSGFLSCLKRLQQPLEALLLQG